MIKLLKSRRVFFGWWIVAGGMGIQALTGGLLQLGYGAYIVLLQSEFGWSKTMLSGAFSMARMENGLLGPLEGWLVDRFGPRMVMRFGIVLFGVGFMLFSQINSVTTFYLTFLMMAAGASLGGFLPITTAIVNWFQRRRATAMGIMATGMSIGGFMVPLVALSLRTFGWRPTAFMSGVLILAIGLPLAQLMRHRPERYGYYPDGDAPRDNHGLSPVSGHGASGHQAAPAAEGQRDFTAREAMRTPAFWLISLGHASALLVVSAVMVHLVSHLTDSMGYSLQAAGAVVSLLTAMSMTGQLAGGFIGDRFSKRWIAAACMIGHFAALLILAHAVSFVMVVMFAILHGLAWGVRGPLMQAIRADYFGRTSFGTIMGFSSMIVMLGNTSGPLVAGAMADRFGNYELGFTLLAGLTGMGSLFFALAKRPRHREQATATIEHSESQQPASA